MNLPNKLTILRVVLIVPFVLCMLVPGLGNAGMYAAVAIFIIASETCSAFACGAALRGPREFTAPRCSMRCLRRRAWSVRLR